MKNLTLLATVASDMEHVARTLCLIVALISLPQLSLDRTD